MAVGIAQAAERFRRPVTALLIISAAGLAGAQAPPQSMIESALRSVRDDQLEIKVGLSLTQTEPFTNWNTQQSELTIPGRAVNVER